MSDVVDLTRQVPESSGLIPASYGFGPMQLHAGRIFCGKCGELIPKTEKVHKCVKGRKK